MSERKQSTGPKSKHWVIQCLIIRGMRKNKQRRWKTGCYCYRRKIRWLFCLEYKGRTCIKKEGGINSVKMIGRGRGGHRSDQAHPAVNNRRKGFCNLSLRECFFLEFCNSNHSRIPSTCHKNGYNLMCMLPEQQSNIKNAWGGTYPLFVFLLCTTLIKMGYNYP